MPRPFVVLILLLNYLLVVCASVTERRASPPARPFDYVHRADCQLKNAWRGGTCFDDCNGIQYHIRKGHKPVPIQQLLSSVKGIDLHCLPVVAAPVRPPFFGLVASRWSRFTAHVPGGVPPKIDAPPRRG